jgi:hypothetical protein
MMPKFYVQIAQLIRETAMVVVDAPSRDELECRLEEVYDEADGSYYPEWQGDDWWGAEKGMHQVIREAPANAHVDYVLDGDEDEEDDEDDGDQPVIIES